MKKLIVLCDYTYRGANRHDTPFRDVPVGALITKRYLAGQPLENINPDPFYKKA